MNNKISGNCEIVWGNCLNLIKDKLSQKDFNLWFQPIKPVSIKSNTITLEVPSAYFHEHLEENYIHLLGFALKKYIGKDVRLEYKVVVDNASKKVQAQYYNSNNTNINNTTRNTANNYGSYLNPFATNNYKLNIDPQLNSEKNFDNFVEGKCNSLARNAGFSIAKNPGKTAFNPLFIYGKSGLGKTHIAQAIGIEVKKNFPEKTVLYVNFNRFMSQYQRAGMNGNTVDFLNFYQMIDVLIIDDIQEISGKTKAATQNTFFHIFNHLHQSGKQLILTSDRSPKLFTDIEDRLLTRFKWGLTTAIEKPDYKTRVEILKKKAHKDGIKISTSVIEYLANNITESIRELEGAMISLLAHSTLSKKDITMDVAVNIVDNLITKPKKREITVEMIQDKVCEYFGVTKEAVQSKTRKRDVVQVRQITMYLSKQYTNTSLVSIGSKIGKRDHSTVLHACKTVNDLIDTDRNFKSNIKDIESKLYL